MLEEIRIANYRGIREGEVKGFGKVNLLIGPNGSGKSTLLETIFLASSNPRNTRFAPSYGSERPLLGLRHGELSFPTKEVWFGKDTTRPIEVSYQLAGDTEKRKARILPRVGPDGGFTIQGVDHPYFGGLRLLDVRVLLDPSLERLAWSDVLNRRFDKELLQTLNEVYSLQLEGFSYTPDTNALKALFSDRNYALNIDDLGSGMRIALRIFMSVLLARESAVLVEEFDGYQHVDTLPRFVEALLALAEKVRCQLFLTTHSVETVKAFVSEACKASSPSALKVFQTALSPDGRFRAAALSGTEADTLLKGGFDLRRAV